jgi:HEAT repeat protein
MSGYGVFRVLKDLVDALQDASDDVRHRAVAILSNYSNDARVVNAVKPLLENGRDDVREAARSVLESKNTPANDTGRGTR